MQEKIALTTEMLAQLNTEVIEALRTVYDPEIPVNIYDLGLIYGLNIDPEGFAHIQMTLTTPGCPVAGTFPSLVEARVREIDAITGASVELVWDPPWTQENMTEAAKLQLGLL